MEKDKNSPLEVRDSVKKELDKYLEQFKPSWKESENLYYGDIWENGQYRPYENDIFKVVESIVPILTDSVSGVTANVDDPAYIEQAKNLVKAIEWVLKKEQFQIKKQQVVRNSLISAPGYIYVDYDYNADDGDGANRLEVLQRYQVRLDGAASFIEDGEKHQIDLYRRKNWLKTRYPRFKDKIDKLKALEDRKDEEAHRGRETQDSGNRNKRRRPKRHTADDILTLNITYIKDTSLVPVSKEETAEEVQKENGEMFEGEGADVNIHQNHELHIQGHAEAIAALNQQLGLPPEASYEEAEAMVESILEENPEADLSSILVNLKIVYNHIEEHQTLANENPQGGRPKYPGGWRVIETVQDIELYDGPSRYEHNEFPVIPFYCYKDNTVYGFGEVLNLVDSQRMGAVMAYKEYKGLQKIANPSVVIDKGSGLTENDVSNEDGAIYEIAEGSRAPMYMQPGQISEQVARFTKERAEKQRELSGVNEATQGEMPAANAAAVTVSKLQTQAIGRIRLKDRNNEHYSMKRLGKILASNILQFWTTEKVLKIEKEGGDFTQVVFNPLDMQDLKYEIDIAPGSMAGVDKDSFNAMLLNFLNGGQITLPQFLEVADIPKAEKLKELVSEEQQRAEEMQALQQENLQLKAQFAPEQLTDEEQKALSEMQGTQ